MSIPSAGWRTVARLFALAAVLLGPAGARADEGHPAFADSAAADPALRAAAMPTLARLATLPAFERLWLVARADVDASVRTAAIEALASLRRPEFAPPMRALAASDPDPGVRALATRRASWLAAFGRSPGVAGFLSSLCAGCGSFYLGQPKVGAAYLGGLAGLVGGALLLHDGRPIELFGEGKGPNRTPTTGPLALPLLAAAWNLNFYSAFDAYRDARLAREEDGYKYPVSRESLLDLVVAPFRPRVLARPWVWAGVPAIFTALFGYSVLLADEPAMGPRSIGEGDGVWFLGRRYGKTAGVLLAETYWASLFVPVAVGEEALFRGFLQAAFIEQFGLWEGWALSSLIFGAAHIPNFSELGWKTGLFAVPFITATGAYLGAIALKTGFELETSVAVHFWYDFLLGTLSFLADPDNQPFSVKISLPL